MDDIDMLQTQNRQLERDNRSLRRKLRDDFAMAALPGVMASLDRIGASFADSIAEDCYCVADAMLKHRQS